MVTPRSPRAPEAAIRFEGREVIAVSVFRHGKKVVILTMISKTEMSNLDPILTLLGASDTITPPILEAYISETISLRIKR